MQQQSPSSYQHKVDEDSKPDDVTSGSKRIASFYGISSVYLNNTIYIYGNNGGNATRVGAISSKDIYNSKSPNILKPIAPSRQINASSNVILLEEPALFYSPGIPLDNLDEILVFASLQPTNAATQSLANATNLSNQTISTNNTTIQSAKFLKAFKFNLNTDHKWLSIPSVSELVPIYRQEHSISLSLPSKDHIYLFGGMNDNLPQNDFWMYSLKEFQWRKLDLPSTIATRCGHTSTMLNNGILVLIGGYTCLRNAQILQLGSQTQENNPLQLVPLDDISVYDTKSSIWMEQPKVHGTIPPPRVYHSAILSSQNEVSSPFQIYLGSQSDRLQDMAAILDTNAWSWRIPKPSHLFQPYPQSHGIISIINETKIVFGLGVNYHTLFDNLQTFDTINEVWESPQGTMVQQGENSELTSIDGNDNKSTHIILWITIACIGLAILLSYVIAIWTFGFERINKKFYNLFQLAKREIWKPRVGEPGWAEMCRLFLKSLFFFLFLYLIFTLTSQVLDSPTIDQLSYEKNIYTTVDVPDIKFCFGDLPEKEELFIRCVTDFGIQCSNFFIKLPTHSSSDRTHEACFLFRAPESFKIGQVSKRLESKGSFLKFEYYRSSIGAESIGQVRVELSNKLQNPNLELYGTLLDKNVTNNAGEIPEFNWDNIKEHAIIGSKEQISKNTFQLNTDVMSTISYELVKHISLNAGAWNYIGVSPSINVQHEIETLVYSESFSTQYAPVPGSVTSFGSLHVFPLYYQTKVLREQKAFAFINAIGIFGGLFGLLFSLQSCLFGYRPRSPWGYMHRWSFGQFRSSLLNGLQTNFFPATTKALANQKASSVASHERPFAAFKDTIRSQMNAYVLPQRNIVYSESYRSSGSVAQQPLPNTDSTIQTSVTLNSLHPLVIPPKDDATYLLPLSPTINLPPANGRDGNEIRMALIEERMHMLERLFQAYYIDDEIFRSLDRALQADALTSFTTDSILEQRIGRKKKK